MSLEYIRKAYQVEAYRGRYVRFSGGKELMVGKITSAHAACLRVRLVDGRRVILHPTDHVLYYPKDARKWSFRSASSDADLLRRLDLRHALAIEDGYANVRAWWKEWRTYLRLSLAERRKTTAPLIPELEFVKMLHDVMRYRGSERCDRCGGLCCMAEFGWDLGSLRKIVELGQADARFGWGGKFVKTEPGWPDDPPKIQRNASLIRFIKIDEKRKCCPNFHNNRCSIYAKRPHNCRYFDCMYFFQMNIHNVQAREALRRVHARITSKIRSPK